MSGHDDPHLLCALWLSGEVDHGADWQPSDVVPDGPIERQWRSPTGERLTLFGPSPHDPADLLDADRATLLAGASCTPSRLRVHEESSRSPVPRRASGSRSPRSAAPTAPAA